MKKNRSLSWRDEKKTVPHLGKVLEGKNDLHVVKQILYDTGQQTVARWPHKRRQKLEGVSYVEMTPDPPKIEKKISLSQNAFQAISSVFSLCFSQWKIGRSETPPPSQWKIPLIFFFFETFPN